MAEIHFHLTEERLKKLQWKDRVAIEDWQQGKPVSAGASLSVLSKFLMNGEGFVEPAKAVEVLGELDEPQMVKTFEAFTAALKDFAVNPTNGGPS